jgi:hypothetical protein
MINGSEKEAWPEKLGFASRIKRSKSIFTYLHNTPSLF